MPNKEIMGLPSWIPEFTGFLIWAKGQAALSIHGRDCSPSHAHTHTQTVKGRPPAQWPRTSGQTLHRLLRAPGLLVPQKPRASLCPGPRSRTSLTLVASHGFPTACCSHLLQVPPGPHPCSRWGSGGLWTRLPRPYLRSHFIKLRPSLKQRPSPGPGPHPGHGRGLGRLRLTAPCLHDSLQLHIGA